MSKSEIINNPDASDNLEYKLQERINQPDIFHSEIDRKIALSFLGILRQKLENGLINRQRYNNAVAALDILVPKRDNKGRRQIADIIITEKMEGTIRSRIESEEVDVTSQNGSWGRLPEEVKRQIILNGCDPMIEMTTNCTVRCPFCAFADKGPIKQKMSFSSVLEILQYFKDNQEPLPDGFYRVDTLYYGTDPFDAKWGKKGGNILERDYNDLAEEYWKLTNKERRYLFTSTAIPVGEELRILRFADNFIKKRIHGEINRFNYLRISRTNANTKRVEAIKKILDSIYDEFTIERLIYISDNRDNNPALRGKGWEKETKKLSIWDIIGPNCRDSVIIGVNSVDGIIMEAASNERPLGETRSPIMKIMKKKREEIVFTIPRYQEKPDLNLRQANFEDIYPKLVFTEIKIKDGNIETQEITVSDNPHRALLKIAGVLGYYESTLGNIKNVTKDEKTRFRNLLLRDIQLVRSYLDSGARNKSMEIVIRFLEDNGFI